MSVTKDESAVQNFMEKPRKNLDKLTIYFFLN